MNQREFMPNDTVESWSVPWHTLQKTLAEALGGEAPMHPLAARKLTAVPPRGAASNWLVKALHGGAALVVDPR